MLKDFTQEIKKKKKGSGASQEITAFEKHYVVTAFFKKLPVAVFSIRFLHIFWWQTEQHWGHNYSIAAHYFSRLKLLYNISADTEYCYLLHIYSHVRTDTLNTCLDFFFQRRAYSYWEMVTIQHNLFCSLCRHLAVSYLLLSKKVRSGIINHGYCDFCKWSAPGQ